MNAREHLTSVRTAVASVPAFSGRVALDRPASTWQTSDGPYAVVKDAILTESLVGDGARLTHAVRLAVDVWESMDGEDPALVPAVVAAIEGATGPGGWRLRVVGTLRLTEDPDLVHSVIDVRYDARG